MISTYKKIFSRVILLTWLIICLLLFIYISRVGYVQGVAITDWKGLSEIPIHISLLLYTLNLLGALLGVVLFSLACLSLGLGVLKNSLQLPFSKLAFTVTAFLVGEILFSLIFLTVISLYRLSPAFVAIIASLGFLVGFPTFKAFIRDLLPFRNLLAGFELSERIILALVIVSLSLGLLLSSTILGYDATADYFSHAKLMAVSHLPVFFHPKHPFIVSSFHSTILFVANIELFGDQAARMLSWVNGIVIILIGLSLGQELGLTRQARLWFLSLMVTSTAFMDLLGDGKIELISTAPILAAIYWARQSVEQPTRGKFLLIGFLSGFAIISRPYNIFLVNLFLALFIASQVLRKYHIGHSDIKHYMKSAFWIMLPLLCLGIFHLFQNWIWLKSPIAPLIYATELTSSDWAWQLDPTNLVLYRLFYPLTLTFSNSPQSLGNISPLLVGFLPFFFLRSVRKNLKLSAFLSYISTIAVFTLIIWVILYFTVLEIRYVFFLWVIIFLVVAKLLESTIQHVDILIRPILRALIIIFLVIMSTRTLLIALIAYFPNDDAQTYCHNNRDNNLCAILTTIDQLAEPGDRVLVLHAYRYYLRPDLFACASQVDSYNILEPLARQDSPDFWMEAYRQGYRFIMFEEHLSERRYNFGKLPITDTAPDWLHIKTLFSSPNATQLVYQLEAVKAPISPEITCKQNSIGVWQLIPLSSSLQP